MDPIEEFYAKHYARLTELTGHYKRRLNLTYQALKTSSEPFSVLEIECGTGKICFSLEIILKLI
jgi:ubiquinone/menaquinone biosynthesis C-methylase UbiE